MFCRIIIAEPVINYRCDYNTMIFFEWWIQAPQDATMWFPSVLISGFGSSTMWFPTGLISGFGSSRDLVHLDSFFGYVNVIEFLWAASAKIEDGCNLIYVTLLDFLDELDFDQDLLMVLPDLVCCFHQHLLCLSCFILFVVLFCYLGHF